MYIMDFSSFFIMPHITIFVLTFGVSEGVKNLMYNLWILSITVMSWLYVEVLVSLSIEGCRLYCFMCTLTFTITCICIFLKQFWNLFLATLEGAYYLLLFKKYRLEWWKTWSMKVSNQCSFSFSWRMIIFSCCVHISSCGCCFT